MHLLPDNLVALLYDPLSSRSEQPLMHDPRGNIVQQYSWQELASLVTVFAQGMSATNFRQGNRVGVVCNTSVNGVVACFANLLNGCINVLIPKQVGASKINKALADSRCQALIIDDAELAMGILDEIHLLPELRQIILLDKTELPRKPQILFANWDDIMTRAQSQPERLTQQLAALNGESEAFIFFIHDKDGELAGLKMTHKQMLAYLPELMTQAYDLNVPLDNLTNVLSIVPWNHPFSWVCGILLPLRLHQQIMPIDPSQTWKTDALPFTPHVMAADAAFLEEKRQAFQRAVAGHSKLEAELLKAGYKLQTRLSTGERAPDAFSRWQLMVLRFLLRRRIKQYLGGSVSLLISVDSSLDDKTRHFYQTLGILMLKLDTDPRKLLEKRV
jgi:long-chain acyl-CoA synthetase